MQPRLDRGIKNHWPAVTSRAAAVVVSAHCGPDLWTIQAAAGPSLPQAARRGSILPKLGDDRAVLMSRSGDPNGSSRASHMPPEDGFAQHTRYLSFACHCCVYALASASIAIARRHETPAERLSPFRMRPEVLSKSFATGAASGAKLPFTGMSAPTGKTDMSYPSQADMHISKPSPPTRRRGSKGIGIFDPRPPKPLRACCFPVRRAPRSCLQGRSNTCGVRL